MYTYKLKVSYNGHFFSGSQIQPSLRNTVHKTLFHILRNYFNDISSLSFSGRTDAGVHAFKQVVSFCSSVFIEPIKIINFINPKTSNILCLHAEIVGTNFDPRRCAIKRSYSYLFSFDKLPVYLVHNVTFIDFKMDIDCLSNLLNLLIGTHDFCLFKKSGSSEKSTIRTIYNASLTSFEYKLLTDPSKTIIIYSIDIEANAFLYRMIRNIVGCIITVLNTRNNLTYIDFSNSFFMKKRTFNFKPAPAAGLYLKNITY